MNIYTTFLADEIFCLELLKWCEIYIYRIFIDTYYKKLTDNHKCYKLVIPILYLWHTNMENTHYIPEM